MPTPDFNFKVSRVPIYQAELERNGRLPKDKILDLLEQYPEELITPEIKIYIAKMIRGEIKGRRGPKPMDPLVRNQQHMLMTGEYNRLLARLQNIRETQGDEAMRREAGVDLNSKEPPHEIAAGIIAEEYLGDKRQGRVVRNIAASRNNPKK